MRFLLRGSLAAVLLLAGCSDDTKDSGVQLVDAGFVNEVSTGRDSGAPDTAASETETSTDTRVDDAQPEADAPETD